MITILIVMMVRPTWSNWSRRAARVECFAEQEESQESRQAAQGISFSSNHHYCDQFDQHCRHHYRHPHMNDDQDQCTWKSDLPTLLSVCLISMEPDTVSSSTSSTSSSSRWWEAVQEELRVLAEQQSLELRSTTFKCYQVEEVLLGFLLSKYFLAGGSCRGESAGRDLR